MLCFYVSLYTCNSCITCIVSYIVLPTGVSGVLFGRSTNIKLKNVHVVSSVSISDGFEDLFVSLCLCDSADFVCTFGENAVYNLSRSASIRW